MRAWTFFPDMLDIFTGQPLFKFFVSGEEAVFFPAADPKQPYLIVSFFVQIWKLRNVVGADTAGTERPNPGEEIQVV